MNSSFLLRLIRFPRPSVAAAGVIALFSLITIVPVQAQELFWINRTSPPTARNLTHLAYLNDQFVAIGDTGTLLTSSDAQAWTPRAVGTPERLFSVTYGNGRYLVVDGNGTIFTSPDAVQWSAATSINENSYFSDILLAFGQGVFVRVVPGREGIDYSVDGQTWLVAQSDTAVVPYSAFGLSGPFNRSILVFTAGRFYLLGYDGVLWTSTNGILWSATTLRTHATFTQLAQGNGRFVIAHSDNSGGYFTSADGTTWTTQAAPALDAVNFANGVFYARELGTNALLRSTDGLVWTTLAATNPVVSPLEAVYANGRYATLSREEPLQLHTSTDAATWTSMHKTPPAKPGVGVAFGNGVYLSGGLLSADGENWTPTGYTVPNSDYTVRTEFAHDRFFVWEEDQRNFSNPGPRSIYSSMDGRTGTKLFTLPGLAQAFEGVAYGNGRFVVVGNTGSFVSVDGATWTHTPFEPGFRGLAFGAGKFVGTTFTGLIMTSEDGVTWTTHYTEPPGEQAFPRISLSDVTYGAGRFIVLRTISGKVVDSSSSHVLISSDGVSWESVGQDLGLDPGGLSYIDGLLILRARGNRSGTSSNDYLFTSLAGTYWARQPITEYGFRSFAGHDGKIVATNGENLFEATVGPITAPTIVASYLTPATLTRGENAVLSVVAGGMGPFSYQWRRNGAPIAGANFPYYVAGASSSAPGGGGGRYDVVVTGAGGSVVSDSAVITMNDSWLANVSSRAYVGTGEDQLIQGFVVRTPVSGRTYQLMARAIGPSLSPLGVKDVLVNPYLRLYRQSDGALLAQNDKWTEGGKFAEYSFYFSNLGAFALPEDSNDAALLPSIRAGGHSLAVTGVAGGTGIALSELYDLDLSPGRLVNLSARAQAGTGDRTLIVGFVIAGGKPLKVLIRAVGPTLASQGVQAPLANPKLTLYNAAGTAIQTNDDWGQAANIVEMRAATAAAGAFALPDNSLDAAILVSLEPGVYTAHATSANSSPGVALIEVYEAP